MLKKQILILLLLRLVLSEDCSNFNGQNGCSSGNQTENPADWADRTFQTPLKGEAGYMPTYQSLGRIMCYADIIYAVDKQSATVVANCLKHASIGSLMYNFNDAGFQSSNSIKLDSSFKKNVTISIQDDKKAQNLDLDIVNLLWNRQVLNVIDDKVYNFGQKGAIIEMFGWPYDDIKQECEALGKMGWMGVKVFPPQEQVQSFEWPQNGELNPWWFYYQPVSYKLNSRHGNREQLKSMIDTCRGFGVRVYADAVVNHMSGGGNDVWADHRNGNSNYCTHWGAKSSTGGSPYFTHNFAFQNSPHTNKPPGLEFPSVPYQTKDFHCERSLSSWSDPFSLNYGWLEGLTDLNTESDYVRERIATYFVDLLSIGFSGFRIDAAKHMGTDNIAAILNKMKVKLGGGDLPEDFITYLEVIIGGEKDLLMCQDNDYNFGKTFENKLAQAGMSLSDIQKIKIWSSDYPKEFPICGNWVIDAKRIVVQNDCADDQNPGSSSRDMGDKGSVLVREKDVQKHRQFEVQLFTRTDADWDIKAVLSSYSFMNDGAMGIPDGMSDCANCKGDQCKTCVKSMKYSKAHDPNACGYTMEQNGSWIEGVYTRVHRDYEIILAMRQWQGLPTVTDAQQLGLPANCSQKAQKVFLMIN